MRRHRTLADWCRSMSTLCCAQSHRWPHLCWLPQRWHPALWHWSPNHMIGAIAQTGRKTIPFSHFYHSFRSKTAKDFVRAVAICGCTSFMFGWHVHEKAILMVVIPLRYVATHTISSQSMLIPIREFLFSLLAASDKYEASQLLLLTIIANYSLFPLLFPHNLLWTKTSLCLVYLAIIVYAAHILHHLKSWRDYLMTHELLYAIGFVGLFLFEQFLQFALKLDQRLPFLPLLLTSIYCGIGITYFWLKYYLRFLLSTHSNASTNSKRTTSESAVKKNIKLKKQKQK